MCSPIPKNLNTLDCFIDSHKHSSLSIKSRNFVTLLLLIFVFLSLNYTDSQAIESKQELKTMLANPDIPRDEKKRQYIEFITRTNPKIAAAMENPAIRASIENSFETMLTGMTTMSITSKQDDKKLSYKEKQERAAAYNQFLNQAKNNKVKNNQEPLNVATNQNRSTTKSKVALKALGSWKFIGVNTDLRSKYSIKNIHLGDSTTKLVNRLVYEEDYNPVLVEQRKGIKLEKYKKLDSDHSLQEIIHLHTHDQIPDIVTSLIYVIKPSENKSGIFSKVDLSLDQLKEKLSTKYGPPLSYDVVMKPSIDSMKNKIEKSFQNKKDRCRIKDSYKNSYDKCIEFALKEKNAKMSNISKQVHYQDCLDRQYDLENYGACLLPLFSDKTRSRTDLLYLSTHRTSGRIKKSADGSALIHNRCFAWAEDSESILLCPEGDSFVIKMFSNKVYSWASNYVEQAGKKKVKADIDL
jgi:hypothetical protein